MRKRKLFKRSVAIFLSAAMLLTSAGLSPLPGGMISAQAAEAGSYEASSYVTNGDFETGDASGWTVNSELVANTNYQVKADSWDTNNSTNAFSFLDATAQGTAISISQQVTLPAGKYYISASNQGKEGTTSFLTLSLGDKSVAMPATTGWAKWATATTESDPLILTRETTVTVSLTGTALDSYWGGVDNIVIYEWKAAANHTFDDLTALIHKVPADYKTMGFTDKSVAAVTAAADTAKALTASSPAADIDAAYEALNTALGKLTFNADIFVEKIANYDEENSIRGVDVSSYLSLMDSFEEVNKSIKDEKQKRGFRDWNGKLLDKQGFFNLLAASGINYVRTRVWNDPYTADKKGYGGGNNDLDKAVEMGKYATNAGMRNLIDFHFSDFRADPSKQKAPKAWEEYTVAERATAISDYVTAALTRFKNEGVDVGMVQIGNETTSKFCSPSNDSQSWDDMNVLFDAGCDAVHKFNDDNGTDILAVLHFTNPERSGNYANFASRLANYDGDGDGVKEGVSYDVFASSYYPYWHGTLDNLTSVLNSVAEKHDKYVMVAETSWATTLEDGDGHDNTVRPKNNDTGNDYPFTVQGQATEVRSVLNAVNNITAKRKSGERAALGGFYWEPAWIPVQVYDADAENAADVLKENKALWEKYGSGWASSFGGEYDAEDAGKWFGGSAVDNQSFFDFNGNPLASMNVFKYLAYGAEAELRIESYTKPSVQFEVGTADIAAKLPSKVSVVYNDGSSKELTAAWNAKDVQTVVDAAATSEGIGAYTVKGTVPLDSGKTYAVTCDVSIIAQNLLKDYSFEDNNKNNDWTIGGRGAAITTDDPKTGSRSLHFYNSSAFSFNASQTVTITANGSHNAYFYIQGGDGGGNEKIYLTAETSRGYIFTSDNVTLTGWKDWHQVMVSGIPAFAGDTITFTIHADSLAAGAWGTVDDAFLYLNEPYESGVTTVELTSDNTTLTVAEASYIYDGTAKEPAVTSVSFGGKTLTAGTDYNVSYSDNINAGKEAKVTITGIGNYSGSVSKTFGIDAASLSGAQITLAEDTVTNDGTAKKPAVTSVVVDGKTLDAKTDYTVSYSDNTEVGTATVTVTGKGNYTGAATTTFTIKEAPPVSLKNASVKLSPANYTYNGRRKQPTVTSVVAADGTKLSSKDFDVTYKNNINAGTATVTITGKGRFVGSVDATFQIHKAGKTITLKSKSITKPIDSKAFLPGATTAAGEALSYKTSNAKIVAIENGKLRVKNYGTAKITVSSAASKNYKAAKNQTVTITVTPKKAALSSAASKKKAAAVVKWKRIIGVSGYTIQYSTNKSFKKAKTYNVSFGMASSATLKKLSPGKKYYVRVRAYKKVKVNGKFKKLTGTYSNVKTVTVKKK